MMEMTKKGQVKCVAKKHKQTPKKFVEGAEHIGSSSYMDNEMVNNYCSDELGSSDPDDSDNESEPKYDKFRVEELDMNYKFIVGLKFPSFDEFKKAITK